MQLRTNSFDKSVDCSVACTWPQCMQMQEQKGVNAITRIEDQVATAMSTTHADLVAALEANQPGSSLPLLSNSVPNTLSHLQSGGDENQTKGEDRVKDSITTARQAGHASLTT